MKNKILNILGIIPSLGYLLLYVPIWNGKHLVLYNHIFVLSVFLFMATCFLLGTVGIIACFADAKNKFFKYLPLISGILSVPVFLFVVYVFTLEFLGIPVIPAQN